LSRLRRRPLKSKKTEINSLKRSSRPLKRSIRSNKGLIN
jgi:hypothetical protein